MESSVDSYLHKKFKKQLSVEARPQINDKEIKNAIRIVESSKEKREYYVEEYNEVIDNQTRSDNKESVPNLSTNENGLYVLNATKSSISVENCLNNLQSAKSCISYVSQNRQNSFEQYKYISFDTKFDSIEPSNSIVSTSSIIDSSYLYPKADYVALTKFEELPPCISAIEKNQFNEEKVEKKLRENPIPPEKNSGGKHVCTYCNLACSKPSVLQKHIRAHTNERPYPCISCGFSFKTRSNLYKHCRSRTHANRVMGNKAQEINNEMEVEPSCNDNKSPHNENSYRGIIDRQEDDYKSKLYKPRFHISRKVIHEPTLKENFHAETIGELKNTNILSHHINELINKNNSILHCQAHLLKKRTSDLVTGNLNNNDYDDANQLIGNESCTMSDPKSAEEPLNLTNKNRKRSISEAIGPTQKSLIKELLLKNLASDMQCPHCKMIFQTVTELELHKLKSCRGFVKPGAKYTRSSSVNVASILTQNKNAFDSMPHMGNASFPLESPGPFLGKTRLVETDKSKSFSFDDGLSTFSAYCKSNDSSQRYLLSPSILHYERERKIPVKLFGGEVKITHYSGETKSFKIDYKGDAFNSESNYINYGGRLSENHVVKSSLQSGGIVLTNKTNYNKQDSTSANQDVIRVYENTSVSPSIDITNLGKTAFTFEGHIESQLSAQRTKPQDLIIRPADDIGNTSSPSHTYTNITDFSQNAVKLLTPNLKQPNLMVPGLPIPNKFDYSNTHEDKQCVSEQHLHIEINSDFNSPQNMNKADTKLKNFLENLKVPHTPVLIPPESTSKGSQQLSNLYNPMNIMVNGKVVRYVPGIPGPIDAESPDIEYMRSNTILSASNGKVSSTQEPKFQSVSSNDDRNTSPGNNKLPNSEKLEIKTKIPLETSEQKSPKQQIIKSPMKSGEIKSTSKISTTEIKRFIRPNSLALKPTTASLKQHHGLTPTMFNQILISPDTPRVAKKYVQQFLNGNYFSYLGLKSTTKPVYCTLNKTQPFYVPHFKKLSMYSEWRQQDTKADKLYVSAYDSRQKCPKFTIASQKGSFLVAHSSYKFITSESRTLKENRQDDHHKNNSILGGYECNEDYTYVRGRGRGRYVCEQCGIRCKKPSMLKKHIRTHSNDRPYTCNHCNFSFKTKGNLTKHMKSKAHTKNYTASNSSCSSTQQSGTQSSDSETEDSGMDSSDESTRQQEHEAAYGLLSLSQKSTHNISTFTHTDIVTTSPLPDNIDSCRRDASISFMNTEEIAFVSKSNFAKNKILEQPSGMKIDNMNGISIYAPLDNTFPEANKLLQYLGGSRPLTYPYTSDLPCEGSRSPSSENKDNYLRYESSSSDNEMEPKCIKRFHVIQKYTANLIGPDSPPRTPIEETNRGERSMRDICLTEKQIDNLNTTAYERTVILARDSKLPQLTVVDILPPILKLNDTIISDTDLRKRKFPIEVNNYPKIHKNDEVMDLSIAGTNKISDQPSIIEYKPNGSSNRAIAVIEELASIHNVTDEIVCDKTYGTGDHLLYESMKETNVSEDNFNLKKEIGFKNNECSKQIMKSNDNVLCPPAQVEADNRIHLNGGIQEQALVNTGESPFSSTEYDNSAMQTLAEIATKQVKLEKNTLAKSVASEYLKLATKNEYSQGERRNDRNNFTPLNKEVDELIVKTEGNKTCTVCSKTFSKPSQLRLHMNIHYIERPFRCDSCSVSFRTKGHLQKHERSASHHNKLSTSPALSSSEPRPFKCLDCNIAFRIHGHLAKHLRSKMHILRLECLAKVPFGLYAELERSNSLLTEINTADGDQCLESLKTLAKKVFLNDADKMKRTSQPSESIETGY